MSITGVCVWGGVFLIVIYPQALPFLDIRGVSIRLSTWTVSLSSESYPIHHPYQGPRSYSENSMTLFLAFCPQRVEPGF